MYNLTTHTIFSPISAESVAKHTNLLIYKQLNYKQISYEKDINV